MKKEKLKLLLILALLLGGLIGGIKLVKKIQETRRGATGPSFSFKVDQVQGRVMIWGQIPGDKLLSAFDVYLKGEDIDAVEDIRGEGGFMLGGITDESEGKRIVGARSGDTWTKGPTPLFSFKVRKESVNLVVGRESDDQTEEIIYCTGEGYCKEGTEEVVRGVKLAFTISPSPTSAPEEEGIVAFPDPQEKTVKVGEEFTVVIKANLGEKSKKAAGFHLVFSDEVLELKGAEVVLENCSLSTRHEGGRVFILLNTSDDSASFSGSVSLFRLTFEGKKEGEGFLRPDNANFSKPVEFEGEEAIFREGNYTITTTVSPTSAPISSGGCKGGCFYGKAQCVARTTPEEGWECMRADYYCDACNPETGEWCWAFCQKGQPSPAPTEITPSAAPTEVTPSPEPSGEVSPTEAPSGEEPLLTFKIKFNYVNYKIPDQVVKVKVKKGSFEKEFDDVAVKSDDEGVLSGRVVLTGVPAGDGYTIFIKGPKHLARKFCVNDQKQRCFGEGELSLQEGVNDFDFTGMPLLAGDIPDEDGKQDGVVDVKDFSLLRRALTSDDEELRERCDLDYNGTVSGRDVVLFLQTLAERYDESD